MSVNIYIKTVTVVIGLWNYNWLYFCKYFLKFGILSIAYSLTGKIHHFICTCMYMQVLFLQRNFLWNPPPCRDFAVSKYLPIKVINDLIFIILQALLLKNELHSLVLANTKNGLRGYYGHQSWESKDLILQLRFSSTIKVPWIKLLPFKRLKMI